MQKILSYTLFIALLGSLSSCKKFLEKNPDNRASLESPEQVAQLLGTAYPQSNYMAFCESISDNVSDKGTGGLDLTVLQPFFFKDVTENEQDSPEGYWNSCYAAISVANQALEACVKATDSARYSSEKGEALVCRAYAHFMLVTLFAKPYNRDSAALNPGIPYVTTPEKVVFQNYTRKTVAYAYEMIEKDLLAGLPLLDDTRYTVPRYHFTKAAANAFASRFFLYKQDYAKALSYANSVFSSTNVAATLRPWNTTYLTLTYNELWAVYAKASEPANLLLVETASSWGRNYFNQRYGMNASKRNEIFSNVTGGTYAFTRQTYTLGTDNYMLPKINEYFVRLSVNATIGYPYVMVPLFTTEEVLFNRIEANIYLNNMGAALQDLNAYIATRIFNYNATAHTVTASKMQAYYNTGDNRLDALYTLLDFKRAEFVQEGMRWFDLARYNEPVLHTTTDGQKLTLEAYDKRRVFQIPASAKLSGLELNPR